MLVNPVGGKGKSRAIVKESVVPLLEAAGCHVEVKGWSSSVTTRREGTDLQKQHTGIMRRKSCEIWISQHTSELRIPTLVLIMQRYCTRFW